MQIDARARELMRRASQIPDREITESGYTFAELEGRQPPIPDRDMLARSRAADWEIEKMQRRLAR